MATQGRVAAGEDAAAVVAGGAPGATRPRPAEGTPSRGFSDRVRQPEEDESAQGDGAGDQR